MGADAFALLGLPRTFDLSRAAIESAYLARVAALHPDAGGGSGDEPDVGAGDLNRARQDLSDPETRANLLLALLGGPTKEQDRSLPPGFLNQMMEAREQMEESRSAPDPAAALEQWGDWARRQRDGHIAAAKELFEQIQRDGATPPRLAALRMRLNAWRYVERMIEQVHAPGPM